MSVVSFAECRCRCHGNDSVRHIAPCCFQCGVCRKRIKTHSYDRHVEACEMEDLQYLKNHILERFQREPTEEEVSQWKEARNLSRFFR